MNIETCLPVIQDKAVFGDMFICKQIVCWKYIEEVSFFSLDTLEKGT